MLRTSGLPETIQTDNGLPRWVMCQWRDEPHPERVLLLHPGNAKGRHPAIALIWQPGSQAARAVNAALLFEIH